MAEIKEGDEVRVYERARRGAGPEPGEVVRVGRTLADIKYRGRVESFRLDTQQINLKGFGYQTVFRTMEQVALDDRRAGAETILRQHKITLGSGHGLTLEQIEALAEVAKTFTEEG